MEIALAQAARTLYSESQRNSETAKHARADEDGDSDFQDYVFILVNVKPAQ